jgi:hypothetical protein
MNKLILIFSGILVVLVIISVVVLVRVNNSSNHTTITTQQGTVTATNFTAKAPYTYTGGATLESAVGYAISYDSVNKVFNIVITKSPVSKYRPIAEAKFLSDLGVSQTDACKLDVTLTTTYDAAPSLFNQNFGLSFCSNGKTFPAGQ